MSRERILQHQFDVKTFEQTTAEVVGEYWAEENTGRFIRVAAERMKLDSPARAYLYFTKYCFDGDWEEMKQEEFWVLCLNNKNEVTHDAMVYRGVDNQVITKVKEIFYPAILHQASAIIIGHNHPSGDPEPSGPDIQLTATVEHAGKRYVDVQLLDHIVVGKDRFVSLKERGLGFD